MANPTGKNQWTGGRAISPGIRHANADRRSALVHEKLSQKTHGLVRDFIKKNPSGAQQQSHLKTLSSTSLKMAMKVTTGARDVGTTLVRSLIKSELSRRKK